MTGKSNDVRGRAAVKNVQEKKLGCGRNDDVRKAVWSHKVG